MACSGVENRPVSPWNKRSQHNVSYSESTHDDRYRGRLSIDTLDVLTSGVRQPHVQDQHSLPGMGQSSTFPFNCNNGVQNDVVRQNTYSSLPPGQNFHKVESNSDQVQSFNDLETDHGLTLDPKENSPSKVYDLETDHGLTLDSKENSPSEDVNDLETDCERRPNDPTFGKNSLQSYNTSLSSNGHFSFPRLHFDDSIVSNESKCPSVEMTVSKEIQTNGDDLEVDGNEETRLKMCEKQRDLWPQGNGCAFDVKAGDMCRRNKVEEPNVKKISRTLKDLTSTEYRHDHLHRGRCLIISNSEFRGKRDRPKRTGSLRDAKTLRRQIQTLGFEPILCSDGSKEIIHENLSKEELLQILSEATNPLLNDHSDFDCFMCVILSYGVAGAVVCPGEMQDEFVEINSILKHFTPQQCPSLAMKPKLFFIQGCTPYLITETQSTAMSPSSETMYPNVTNSLPSMADFLVQFCGVDGALGWGRNRQRGLSFYVQALCRCLKEFCNLKIDKGKKSPEMGSLILRINRAFVDILEDDDLMIDEIYCVPTTTSTLTKRMYFYPKVPEDDLEMDTGPS